MKVNFAMPPLIASLSSRLFGGPASAVFRGMGTLVLGAGAARVIGVASIPVLTRIYSPADYGVLAVFTALTGMLVPVLTLRYGVAVPLPRHDGMAMNLMALSALLMLSMTLVVTLILAIFGSALLGLASMEVLAPYWWLIALSMVGAGSYELLSMWATRRRAYRIVAQTQATQSAFGTVVKIGLGLLAFKPMGLIIGEVVAASSGIGSFITRFWVDLRRTAGMISLRRMGFVARYYCDFPIYRLPSQFLLVFSTKGPMIFVLSFFGLEIAGYFGLAWAALILPSYLISNTIGKAYYGEIACLASDLNKIMRITKRVAFVTSLASVLFFLILLFFAEILFSLVFGSQWREAGRYASIISIYILASMVSVSLSSLLNVISGQRNYFLLNAIRTVAVVGVFWISGIAAWDIFTTLRVYSFTMFFFHASTVVWFFFILKTAIKNRYCTNKGR